MIYSKLIISITSIYEYLNLRFGSYARSVLTGELDSMLRTVKLTVSTVDTQHNIAGYLSDIFITINIVQWIGCLCASTCNESGSWSGYQYRYHCCWLRLYLLYIAWWHESCHLD